MLTFYWPCEDASLTGGYSAGASSLSATGDVSFSATAQRTGTNGILTTNATDYYSCSSASIFTIDEFSVGVYVNYRSTIPTSGLFTGITFREAADANNTVSLGFASSQEARLTIRRSGGSILTLTTSAANVTADDWYFYTFSGHLSADKRRLRVYDNAGTLVEEVEDTSTDLSGATPATIDQMRVGNNSSHTGALWLDNVFVGNSYDDASMFYEKRNISDYSEYAGGALVLPTYYQRPNTLLRL